MDSCGRGERYRDNTEYEHFEEHCLKNIPYIRQNGIWDCQVRLKRAFPSSFSLPPTSCFLAFSVIKSEKEGGEKKFPFSPLHPLNTRGRKEKYRVLVNQSALSEYFRI